MVIFCVCDSRHTKHFGCFLLFRWHDRLSYYLFDVRRPWDSFSQHNIHLDYFEYFLRRKDEQKLLFCFFNLILTVTLFLYFHLKWMSRILLYIRGKYLYTLVSTYLTCLSGSKMCKHSMICKRQKYKIRTHSRRHR